MLKIDAKTEVRAREKYKRNKTCETNDAFNIVAGRRRHRTIDSAIYFKFFFVCVSVSVSTSKNKFK